MNYKLLQNIFTIVAVFFAFNSTLFAKNADDAEKFVRDLYAHYTKDGNGINFTGPQTNLILSDQLYSLIKKNISVLHGEAGVLSTDPFCDCQDFDLKLVNIAIKTLDTTRAEANVSFINLGTTTNLNLKLLKTSLGWRIDDIVTIGSPSLRQKLKKEIRELK